MLAEYKFITGTQVDVQRTLNQWRHKYDLVVVSHKIQTIKTEGEEICAVFPEYVMLVTRLEKPNPTVN